MTAIERAGAILHALRTRWLSVAEVRPIANFADIKTCRAWLNGLASVRVLRMRCRPKIVREDGEFRRGQYEREYRLRTDFGGLDP